MRINITVEDGVVSSALVFDECSGVASIIDGVDLRGAADALASAGASEIERKVMAEQALVPPPSQAETPEQAIRARAADEIAALTAAWPGYEQQTWPTQLVEAMAIVAGQEPATCYLSSMVDDRIAAGLDGDRNDLLLALAQRVMGHADALAVASQRIVSRADAQIAAARASTD